MNKRIFFLVCSLLLVILLSGFRLSAQTQKPINCREPEVSAEKIKQLLQSRSKKGELRSQRAQKQLRVYFHIVTNDNGTQAGATEAEVMGEFERLQADFTDGSVCFVYAGLNVIANTTLNHIDIDNNSDAEDLFEARKMPGCLDVFYTHEIRGTNPSSGGRIGGYAFDIPSTFCLVSSGSVGRHTTSHEIGHCLGLFHTFSTKGFGYEYIDGSGCDIRGDLICDTRADPYAYNEETCYSESANQYTGTCEDPGGSRNFSPPYNNIMSYWHEAPETFTSNQFDAMHYTIEDDDDVNNVASSDNYTVLSSSYSAGGFFQSAINQLTTVGNVEFSGLVMAGLYGKTVLLTPGFHAHSLMPVIIRATECITTGTTAIARSVAPAPASTKQSTKPPPGSSNTQLVVYPNPASNFFNLSYSETKLFNAVITVRNTHGIVMYTIRKNNVMQIQEKVNMSGKAKGVYFVELLTGTNRITSKVLLQ